MGILRFILAITVVTVHSSAIFGFTFVGGQIAVQTFYIISGFYMSLILNEKYIGRNNSYALFISNRFLRLFPIYWTVLLLTIIYSVLVAISTKGQNAGQLTNYVTYSHIMSFKSLIFLGFTNIFLLFQDAVMFMGLNVSSGELFFTTNFANTTPQLFTFLFIPQAWTIGIEISFYLIAPFLVRKKPIVIFSLIILSILLRLFLVKNNLKGDPWSYRFFPTELVFFLLGIISYHIYQIIRNINIKEIYPKILFAIILVFTLSYNFFQIPGKSYFYFFIFFICLPFVFKLTKKWKKDSYIGELSYPIYISHILVLICINAFKIPIIGSLGLTVTFFTILFSILLNELVAKRIESIRQKRINPSDFMDT
jgi:peptidoglycan/LPS O-acetylase OafA/YrhL